MSKKICCYLVECFILKYRIIDVIKVVSIRIFIRIVIIMVVGKLFFFGLRFLFIFSLLLMVFVINLYFKSEK